MRGLTISLIAATAVAGYATLASAQTQQAGVSAAVRGQVALARASQNIVGKQIQSGDPIFLGDAITSGRASGLQVMLLDETVFTIGPNSEISIDEFVYDPSTNAGKVTASVAKGAFRFITGKIARKRPEDMTVRLPTATIGIRGTIVAGVVRTAPGEDAGADAVFKQLSKDSPGAENARDFVILLGPGGENNTNDKGGAFVFAANPPKEAQRGLSAGGATPPSGLTGPGSPGYGTNFPPPVINVSRTGSAAVGFEDGDPQGPFFVTDFVRLFTRVFPATIQGTKPANDPGAKEANDTAPADADSLSGNTIADSVGDAAVQADLGQVAEGGGEIVDPTATAAGNSIITTLSDVSGQSGLFVYTIPTTQISGIVNGSYSGAVDLNLGQQTLGTNVSGSFSGPISGNFTLNGNTPFSDAFPGGIFQGSFDSNVDPELNLSGNGQVIASGTFVNDSNGPAGSVIHSITILNNGTVHGFGAGQASR